MPGACIVGVPSVLQFNNALIQLVVRVLPERLVRPLPLLAILVYCVQITCIVHSLHLGTTFRLVDIEGRAFWRLRRDVAYSTHSTLEPYVIHFVNRLTCLLHDAKVPVFLHRCDFTFEPV